MSKYKRIALIVLCGVLVALCGIQCFADSIGEETQQGTIHYISSFESIKFDLNTENDVQASFALTTNPIPGPTTLTYSSVESPTLGKQYTITEQITPVEILSNTYTIFNRRFTSNNLSYTLDNSSYRHYFSLQSPRYEFTAVQNLSGLSPSIKTNNQNETIRVTTAFSYYVWESSYDIETDEHSNYPTLYTYAIQQENSDGSSIELFPQELTNEIINKGYPNNYTTADTVMCFYTINVLLISNIKQDLDISIIQTTTTEKEGFGSFFSTFFNDGSIDINMGEKSTNILNWLSTVTDGFLNTDLFGNFSIGDILIIVIGIGALFAILKYFAGG